MMKNLHNKNHGSSLRQPAMAQASLTIFATFSATNTARYYRYPYITYPGAITGYSY
jgi:hypothetical protein